ncbi:conserved oligomeric Golgi complex subunit 6 [Tanacetum coccineum]
MTQPLQQAKIYDWLVFSYALSLWKHGKNDQALSVDLVVALAKEDVVKFNNDVKEFDGVTKVDTMTRAKSMKGTPYWMAPQVIGLMEVFTQHYDMSASSMQPSCEKERLIVFDVSHQIVDFIPNNLIAKSLSNCNATTRDIITTTEKLKQESEVPTQRQEITSCFLRDYQLSNKEINALREEELNENYFKALNHVQTIHANCKRFSKSNIIRGNLQSLQKMEPMNMTQLCDINPMIDDLKVLARYTSLWKSHRAGRPKKVWALDMVFQYAHVILISCAIDL